MRLLKENTIKFFEETQEYDNLNQYQYELIEVKSLLEKGMPVKFSKMDNYVVINNKTYNGISKKIIENIDYYVNLIKQKTEKITPHTHRKHNKKKVIRKADYVNLITAKTDKYSYANLFVKPIDELQEIYEKLIVS